MAVSEFRSDPVAPPGKFSDRVCFGFEGRWVLFREQSIDRSFRCCTKSIRGRTYLRRGNGVSDFLLSGRSLSFVLSVMFFSDLRPFF